jgi:hypothetical protein
MIRIERGDETEKRRGVFEYHAADRVRWPRVCGESDQPLPDACRQLKSLYGVTAQAVAPIDGAAAPAPAITPGD